MNVTRKALVFAALTLPCSVFAETNVMEACIDCHGADASDVKTPFLTFEVNRKLTWKHKSSPLNQVSDTARLWIPLCIMWLMKS